jgi:hypothetical protein
MFTLRKGVQGFTVIDGAMTGKSFKQGMSYPEIPPQETAKFEKIVEDEKQVETQDGKGEKSFAPTSASARKKEVK